MYLKQVRLQGFKSFADPTTLDLRPGVTAIVGPNGCGKSNVADAVRWVLGEQSAKSLRAGQMADVIFQGSHQRKPLSLCEVSLLFTDCEAQLGTEFREVEVVRRVTRDGGSDYFLNGKRCRLKDVQRLFLDTGVGQVSYSFMLQGQIDQILSSNPHERRAIFEEAAGISKYKSQRREALAKLQRVEENLNRVTDVLAEVERQAASVRRQAAKAVRYRHLKRRHDGLHLALVGHEYAELRHQWQTRESTLGELRQRAEALREARAAAEAEETALRQEASALTDALQAIQQTIYEVRSDRDACQAQIHLLAQRRTDAAERRARVASEVTDFEAREADLARRLTEEQQAQTAQRELFSGQDDSFRDLERAVSEAEARLADSDARLRALRQTVVQHESQQVRLRSRLTTLEVEARGADARIGALTEDLQRLRGESATSATEGQTLRASREELLSRLAHHQKRLSSSEAEKAQILEAFRAAQKGIQESTRALAMADAQIAAVTSLISQMEGLSDSAKKAIRDGVPGALGPGQAQALYQHLRVSAEDVPAVEAALGAALEAVVVESDRLLPLISGWSNQGQGRLPVALQTAGQSAAPLQFPEATDVASLLRADRPEWEALARSLVSGCYVVPDAAAFVTWWRAHPEASFRMVVTPRGDLVHGHGLLQLGLTPAKGRDGLLARAERLERLRAERATLVERDERHRATADHHQHRLTEIEKALEDTRGLVSEVGREVSALESQIRQQERQIEQTDKLLRTREREVAELTENREARERQLADVARALAQEDEALLTSRASLATLESDIVTLRADRDTARDRANEARLHAADQRQRLLLLERGVLDLQQRLRELSDRRARSLRDIESLAQQDGEWAAEEERSRQRIGLLEASLQTGLDRAEKLRRESTDLATRLRDHQAATRADREALEKQQALVSEAELAQARLQAQLEHLAEGVRRETQRDVEALDPLRELWFAGDPVPERLRVDIEEDDPLGPLPTVPEPRDADLKALVAEWPRVREERDSLRARIQALGAINDGAVEEYRELNDRHRFLKAQADDLWSSRTSLTEAINEINETSQALFAETFAKVRANFAETFQTLFGGGQADLTLATEGDPLERGIDIAAQPPGTRLRSLALLSGGQKTMTAVALLFAIYKVKPSPFCVLDEIDAPLDDANIGRFTQMLKDFLQFSQFLIITHNKRTISIADTIYGITMPERGVSRAFSMSFHAWNGAPESPGVTTSAQPG